ncbi:MAG: ppa [Thermoleophilia bacterium]|nr:ppa [Thermoleophilia bacterium]
MTPEARRTLDMVVEIPKGSRNKYEIDHERHVVRLDRRLFSATTYPADYGFFPDTLAEDGDPLDALVLLEEPTVPGCYVEVRPLGVLWMEDEQGPDAKVICVAANDPAYEGADNITDLPSSLLAEIRHFFDVYKDLEPGKRTSIAGYDDAEVAWREIDASVARYPGPAGTTP